MQDMNDLNRLDLNLLTVFAAVAQTRSVTLAAQRLALSQPAVSHALGRLRKAFDDPLFVRSREGLVPTVRGRTLMAPIQAILDSVGGLFHSPPFDQETSRREFRIGASDYAIMTVAPRLIRAVHLDAPHVKLEITPICEHPLRALEAGDLDGALWNTSSSDGNFCGQELFREKFMGLIWERHPLAAKARKGALSVEDYLAYPHIAAVFRDSELSPLDAALAAQGRSRTIAASTPKQTCNIEALIGTDLIMTLPSRLVLNGTSRQLTRFDLPIPCLDFACSVIWHHRLDSDPGWRWFLNVLQRATAEPSPHHVRHRGASRAARPRAKRKP